MGILNSGLTPYMDELQMLALNKLPLAKQISYASASLIGGIFVILIGAAATYTASATRQSAEASIVSSSDAIVKKLDIAYSLSKESTNRLADLFESNFKGNMQVAVGQTMPLGGAEVPKFSLNGHTITGDFTLPDQFASSTGGVATVFVKSGDDFVRVSTSLKKENGERAVGTKLDRKHPAYERLLRGETYLGDATLFGTRYMTKYVPVKSESGQADVVLFVGFNIENLLGTLQDSVLTVQNAENGQPYVLRNTGTKAGQVFIHANLKGDEFNELSKSHESLKGLMDQSNQLKKGITEVQWTDAQGIAHDEIVAFASTDQWGGLTVFSPVASGTVYARVYEVVGILIACGVAAALGLALALAALANQIAKPAKRLTELAQRLGRGDLTARASELAVQTHENNGNEMNTLALSMNRMADNMEKALMSVKTSTHRVQNASLQLVQSSDDLAQGATQESDAASDMATAVEEMGSSIASVGESAAHTKSVSLHAKQLADEGLGAINSATQQMEQISSTVENTAEVISALGEQSRQISDIALIIQGIAEQTNLLALNAAIEAARAGEQGRGFSVVADEVRKLAERTRVSTNSIHGMIDAIQQSSETAVENMARAVDSVKLGVTLVEKAGMAMHQITEESQAVAGAVHSIDEALFQQSKASESIGHQVSVVAELSDRNLQVARHASQAVGDLQQVASELSGVVLQFQVSEGSIPKS